MFGPQPAAAHTVLQGVGSLWSGAAHLLTSLDRLGFLLALAIWTSFHDARLDARVIASGLAALFTGGIIAAVTGLAAESGAAAALLMLIAGLAGAARWRAGAVPVLGLASVGGLIGGAAAGPAGAGLGAWVSGALFALGGALAGGSVLSYGLLGARRLDREWGGIARRAAASWIAAVGLMMLALTWARGAGRI